MGINITQFSPPGTVSKLVWDDDMKPGTGKVFKGDLTGNVTGNVTGDVTGDVTGNVTGVLNGGIDAKYTLSQTKRILTIATVIPAYSSGASSGTFVDGLVATLASVNAINPACVIFNNQGATYPFSLNVVTGTNQEGTTATYKTYNAAGTELSSVTVDVGAYTLSIGATVNKITYAISGGDRHSASCDALYAVFD